MPFQERCRRVFLIQMMIHAAPSLRASMIPHLRRVGKGFRLKTAFGRLKCQSAPYFFPFFPLIGAALRSLGKFASTQAFTRSGSETPRR